MRIVSVTSNGYVSFYEVSNAKAGVYNLKLKVLSMKNVLDTTVAIIDLKVTIEVYPCTPVPALPTIVTTQTYYIKSPAT